MNFKLKYIIKYKKSSFKLDINLRKRHCEQHGMIGNKKWRSDW
jgi:hypothetical protein